MLSSELENREKESLLKFFLTKGMFWYNDVEDTHFFASESSDLKVPKGIAEIIAKANDSYLNSIFG